MGGGAFVVRRGARVLRADAQTGSEIPPILLFSSLYRMKYLSAVLLVLLFVVSALPAAAQVEPPEIPFTPKSQGKALGLSLLLPGLGHRYVQDGSWRGAATVFTLADVSMALGLLGSDWRHGQVVESFETLAASRAGADLAGKNRRFFLNLASFQSSDEFLDVQLRNRAWDQINYVSDPSYQWRWESEADFREFRALRNEADSWSRRRTLFISTLVANRLIAGFAAIRAARSHNVNAPDLALSFAPPPAGTDWPVLNLSMRW
jgi:hypothetical protein